MYRIINKEFKIIGTYKSFLLNLDNYLENVPRKDLYLKDEMRRVAYELLQYLLICNNLKDKEKLEDIYVKIKGDISTLDFLLERLYEKKYINEKGSYNLGLKLVEVNKMSSTWINNKLKDDSKN